MTNQTTIKCPNCGTEIDINEVLYHQLENKYKNEHLAEKKKLEAEIEAKRKEYKTHLDSLKVKEEEFKEQKEKFEEEIKKAIDESLKIQLNEIERYKIMTEEEQKNHIKSKESISQSFIDIEKSKNKPLTYEEIMQNALLIADKKVKELEHKIEIDKPKVVFVDDDINIGSSV